MKKWLVFVVALTLLVGCQKRTGYFYFAEVVSGVLTNNEPYKIKEMRFVNRYEQAKFPPQLDDLAQKIFLQHLIDDRQTAWL